MFGLKIARNLHQVCLVQPAVQTSTTSPIHSSPSQKDQQIFTFVKTESEKTKLLDLIEKNHFAICKTERKDEEGLMKDEEADLRRTAP